MLTYNRTYHSSQKKSHSVLNMPYNDNLHQFSKAPKKENDDQNKKILFRDKVIRRDSVEDKTSSAKAWLECQMMVK